MDCKDSNYVIFSSRMAADGHSPQGERIACGLGLVSKRFLPEPRLPQICRDYESQQRSTLLLPAVCAIDVTAVNALVVISYIFQAHLKGGGYHHEVQSAPFFFLIVTFSASYYT